MYRVAEGVNLELVDKRIKESSNNTSKKASKKGAFMIFLYEHLEDWKKEGRNVSTMRNAVNVGDFEWRKLSSEEKAVYKEKAAPVRTTSPITITSKDNIEEMTVPEDKKFQVPVTMDHMTEVSALEHEKNKILEITNSDEDEGIVLEPAMEASRIKHLSIIYEENENEISSSDAEPEICNTLGSEKLSNAIELTSLHSRTEGSINDMNIGKSTYRNTGRNLKYPLRRPSIASLIAKRKLNFSSSNENLNSNRDDSMEISACSSNSPNLSSNYLEIKSSSPIKNSEIKSDICDISPIKAEKHKEFHSHSTSTSSKSICQESQTKEELVASIEKLIKQADDLMNHSLWDIVY